MSVRVVFLLNEVRDALVLAEGKRERGLQAAHTYIFEHNTYFTIYGKNIHSISIVRMHITKLSLIHSKNTYL